MATDVIVPRALPAGGRIGIIAPSGPVKEDRLRVAIGVLRGKGFDVVTAPSAFGNAGLFSASDETRRAETEAMFARDDIDAVFCTRGGVGASRLLERLDTSLIAASRKPFLGFSDVTALQWALFARHRFISFSGPLAVEWNGGVSERSQKNAIARLSATAGDDLLADFERDDLRVIRGHGKIRGRLMPGNLTMITTLLGTPFLPDLHGAVLIIEDVSEPAYRLDRLLFHLRNAGILSQLSGLLTGELSDDPAAKEQVRASLLDATRGTDYPIVIGLPYGHGSERMTIPVGAMAEFDTAEHSLLLCEPIVAGASA